MLYTETTVRDNIRTRGSKRVFLLGSGDRLTAAARDWLAREGIPILPARDAVITRYRLLSGGFAEEKPEHMTHLHSDLLVSKNHPRIRFRGQLDRLEASLLWVGSRHGSLQHPLQELLELTRLILKQEVLNQPLEDFSLCGLSPEEIRRHSHFPQEYYGQPHFMPSMTDCPVILELNQLRCIAREAELWAVEAFCDREGIPTREDLLRALNRISSMLYILMIREKAKQEKEKPYGSQYP